MPKRQPSLVIPGKILDHVEEQGGVLSLNYNPQADMDDRWMAAYHFGREAEDSDMVGGAAYGIGSTVSDAFGAMLLDLSL